LRSDLEAVETDRLGIRNAFLVTHDVSDVLEVCLGIERNAGNVRLAVPLGIS
jgi:hypothetical protein